MTDTLRDRIAAVLQAQPVLRANIPAYERDWATHVADAVIEVLTADCIYRYACHRCGDFWFDTSQRMQRFALLHGKAHADA